MLVTELDADDPRAAKVVELVNELVELLNQRHESEQVALSGFVIMIGTILGNICNTERSLFGMIMEVNDALRSTATDTFVHMQKLRARRQR